MHSDVAVHARAEGIEHGFLAAASCVQGFGLAFNLIKRCAQHAFGRQVWRPFTPILALSPACASKYLLTEVACAQMLLYCVACCGSGKQLRRHYFLLSDDEKGAECLYAASADGGAGPCQIRGCRRFRFSACDIVDKSTTSRRIQKAYICAPDHFYEILQKCPKNCLLRHVHPVFTSLKRTTMQKLCLSGLVGGFEIGAGLPEWQARIGGAGPSGQQHFPACGCAAEGGGPRPWHEDLSHS